jgi:GxxExxY protein
MQSDDSLHQRLSYEIVGVLTDVHNNVGPGWDEYPYHEAVLAGLHTAGMHASGKVGGQLYHRGFLAGVFELDILVERCVILELKHLDSEFVEADFAQINDYLKFWQKDLGILVDFGQESLRYQRVPYTPVDGVVELAGPWESLQARCDTADRVAAMLKYVLQTHGLGYSVECNRKLFRTECRYQRVACEQKGVELIYRGKAVARRTPKAFLVAEDLLVLIAAHPENPTAKDAARLKSYMKQMGIGYGILANFGKRVLTLRAMLTDSAQANEGSE